MPYSISVAGESGSGKTEIAKVLSELIASEGKKVMILAQDDYFKLPPFSNHLKRIKNINWVGPKEVKLSLLNKHAQQLKHNGGRKVIKPLINFDEDQILTEELMGPYDVIIVEGTYTTLLENIDIRIFINRDYHDTLKHRIERNRDQELGGGAHITGMKFLEEVLEIEHHIIRKHKQKADLVIPPPHELLVDK
jgi:uridine kinase